ncbi:MAG: glycine--tRNA ligase subunit beta [bacterium]
MLERLPLLVEIGSEEIPPAFLAPTAAGLERRLRDRLAAEELDPGRSRAFYTPRRLAVLFEAVAPERPGREVEVQGPPRKAAFDAAGRPTRTAEGFSRAAGRTVADLYVKDTPRGEYVFLRRAEPPARAAALLEEALPGIIADLPFARSMRWLEDKTRFARPVRWLVGLLGEEVIPFRFAGLVAGRATRGHRRRPGPVELATAADYEAALTGNDIIADPGRRRAAAVEEITRLAAGVGATAVLDPELVEETVNITECPVPILCRFDPSHLALPGLILVTALKMHQRSFAVEGPGGGLLPHFVGVADTPGCDAAAVGRWFERAVESRLRDARFFFDADVKKGLAALVEEEKRVTWFEGMGSYHDKTGRIRALCIRLAGEAGGVDAALLDRAALLSKADLLTEMVREKEFTSLQGRVGGIYARLAGEPADVADAIAEQYLPVNAGDPLPATRAGALLAVADRVDNIVATFLAGEIPTGSEDPYGLRRQAAGTFAIIIEHGLSVDVRSLADAALALFPGREPDRAARLPGFFLEREAQALADRDVPYDIADAVIAAIGLLPLHVLTAARALVRFRDRPEFEKLVIGQKRVANILRGQRVEGEPDPARLVEPAEKELLRRAAAARPAIESAAAAHEWERALELLLGLREPIDRLFDEVLVMDKDEQTRLNRLRLLLAVRSLFRKVADLSRVVLEGEPAS